MSKRLILALLSAAALSAVSVPSHAESTISGAGATFPYPVYAKWAEAYKAQTGIGLNYQSIGSGGGIKQIEAKTVDFGASDMPLEPADLDKNGLFQFPTVLGGVVPVVNIKGIDAGKVRLDGTVLTDIYLGKIKKWDDAAIKALNPGLTLPGENITTVHRSDGSGTNFIFTHYLSQVSPEFKSKIGENTSVEWPGGVGAKGNEGVSSYARQINGSIGYVEYAYAKQNKLAYVLMKDHDGDYVAPDAGAFAAAAAGADWSKAPGFHLLLTDQPGKNAWPIAGATFILMHKKQDKPDTAKQVVGFFKWAYEKGGDLATQLDYVPLPDSVTKLIDATWQKTLTDDQGKPVLTN